MSKTIVFLTFLFAFCVSVPAAQQVGPIDVTGEINGAPYRIAVPADWNGTLLIYVHGYRDKADHPGEIDNRDVDLTPNASFVPILMAQGYALASSAYRDNGWVVEEGVHDIKDLTGYFRDNIAQPDRTILWAFSFGAIIGLESMEKFGGIYDGALCACPYGAGATSTWDAAGDLALAYDTLFGMPAAWGNFGDIRDDIDFETEVLSKIVAEVSNPINFPKFEFIRLVVGTPGRGITPGPTFYPAWLFPTMFYATEVRSELERRAGGPIVQNLDREYSLTASERAYLMGFGIPGAVIDGWLLQMNGNRTVSAPNYSRNYVERNANFNGKILNPVLTMNSIIDPLATVSMADRYERTVANAGRSRLLFQTYTTGSGHCAFTGPQVLTALDAIHTWVKDGVKPTAATFPAALGFDTAFVPPAMLQP
jgi:hypothetical protein